METMEETKNATQEIDSSRVEGTHCEKARLIVTFTVDGMDP